MVLYVFGLMAFVFPLMVGYSGWLYFRGIRDEEERPIRLHTILRSHGFVLTMAGGAALAFIHHGQRVASMPLDAGGVLGHVVVVWFASAFSTLDATLILLALFLTGVTLFTGLSWLHLMDSLGGWALRYAAWCRETWSLLGDKIAARKARRERVEKVETVKKKTENRPPPRIEPVITVPKQPTKREVKEKQSPLFDTPVTVDD